jgi:membrane-bound serine protease (ClpP class)
VDNTGPNFFADKDFGVRPMAILPTSIFCALLAIFVGYKAVAAWRMRPTTGDAGLVGETGDVREELAPGREGRIFVHGELWNAVSDRAIPVGARVKVVEIQGLKVRVEPEAPSL